jgi:pimeloyl-ACP methyl ester carboxylesterase
MSVLAHLVDGGGEPLLLLNGGMMTMRAWDAAVARLATTHRVIRCDFRGQLMSLGLGEAPATLRDHAEDVTALLAALEIPRVHVVGASFGALAAVELAAAHPNLVQSLVLVTATDVVGTDNGLEGQALRSAIRAAAGGGDGRPVLDVMAPFTFSPEWLDANAQLFDARRAQFALLPAAWYAGLDRLLAAMENLDLRPSLARLTAPTLVVGAERDRIFPLDRSRALAGSIRGAELLVIAGAPHGWVGEDPGGFADRVLPFLCAHSMRNPS